MSSRFDARRRRTVRRKRSNTPLIILAVIVLIAVGTFSYLYLIKPEPSEEVPEETPVETEPPEIPFVKKIVLTLPKYDLPEGVRFSKEIGPTFPLANTKHYTGVYTLNGDPDLYVHIIEGPDNTSVNAAMNPILQDMGVYGTGEDERIDGTKVTFHEYVAGKPDIVYISYLNRVGLITTGSGSVTKELLRDITSRALTGEIGVPERIIRVITIPEPPKDDLPDGIIWGRQPINPIRTKKVDVEAYTGIYSANGKGLFVHIVRGNTLEDTQKEMNSRLSGLGAEQAAKSTETINWISVTKYTDAQGEYDVYGYIYTWYKGDTGYIVDAVEGVSEDTVVSMVRRVMR